MGADGDYIDTGGVDVGLGEEVLHAGGTDEGAIAQHIWGGCRSQ